MAEEEKQILVVEDTPTNIDILVEGLGGEYEVAVALNGDDALDAMEASQPDLILLDIMMPGMDGFEVLGRIRENPRWREIPVIFLTAMSDINEKTRGFQAGAVDYITKPFEMLEVQARIKTQLSLKEARDFLDKQNAILEERVRLRTEELQLTRDVTIEALASLSETRDNETGHHIRRTQEYIKVLAEAVRDRGWYVKTLTDSYIELLHKSAPLHDIGKVGIRDAVLLKPDSLTPQEFEEMKTHTVLGAESLKRANLGRAASNFLSLSREIALTHHEKWNGTGYPRQLQGEEVPLSGRLMAIGDVYDALINKRVYKPAFSHARAVEIIRNDREKLFDPRICDTFLDIHPQFEAISKQMPD
jgi:putative two-component system response regulator